MFHQIQGSLMPECCQLALRASPRPALPAHEAFDPAPSPVQPARAGHTLLCDVGSRRAVVGAGQALFGGVRTYLWCHLSCSDK